MGICGTCKFWKHRKDFDYKDRDYMPDKFCHLATYIEHNTRDEDQINSKCMASEPDDYVAYLETQADFGCNQWQSVE